MSHFVLYVTVPKDQPDLEAFVDKVMERYSEEREVEPYPKTCECLDGAAETRASEETVAKVGPFLEFRDTFVHALKGKEGMTGDEEAVVEAAWREHIKPYVELEARLKAKYLAELKPKPGCRECGGTGKVACTYNPESRWDWFRVGGRWDGDLVGRPVRSEDGFNFDERHEGLEGNVAPVSYVLAEKRVPFALLTPDGEWHERAHMGWWGMTSGAETGWASAVADLLAPYADTHVVVALDCHI